MANAHVSGEVAHIASAKDISDQPIASREVNALALSGCNTCGVLPPVLQQ
jgi:hypothetical protein